MERKGENKASMTAILPQRGRRTNTGLPQAAFGSSEGWERSKAQQGKP
jgi:hypothetical protein